MTLYSRSLGISNPFGLAFDSGLVIQHYCTRYRAIKNTSACPVLQQIKRSEQSIRKPAVVHNQVRWR